MKGIGDYSQLRGIKRERIIVDFVNDRASFRAKGGSISRIKTVGKRLIVAHLVCTAPAYKSRNCSSGRKI